MSARIDDSSFHEALAYSGLRLQETLYTRRFHQRVSKTAPVLRHFMNGVWSMGLDVADKTRDNDGLPISSHWLRLPEMSFRRNHEYINATNIGRYALRGALNYGHDIAEERFEKARRENPNRNASKLRAEIIQQTQDELLEIFDEACIATGVRPHGKARYERIFGGVQALDILPNYFDCFTPGYKARTSLGSNSAIEIGHKITLFHDIDDLESALINAEIKINDRVDNGPNIFPKTDEWAPFFNLYGLQRKRREILKDPASKERYVDEFRSMEEESEHRVISLDRRATELFKLVWMFSQSAELFEASKSYKSERIAAARRPGVRAARESLERLLEATPKHMLALTVYEDLPRKGKVRADGSPLPDNDAELHDYVLDGAKEYWSTPEAREFQGSPGLKGLRIFHGTMARMARVEANLGSARRRFKKDPLDNLVRSALIRPITRQWLPKIKTFQTLSDGRHDLSRIELDYFPNLYERMKELLNEEQNR